MAYWIYTTHQWDAVHPTAVAVVEFVAAELNGWCGLDAIVENAKVPPVSVWCTNSLIKHSKIMRPHFMYSTCWNSMLGLNGWPPGLCCGFIGWWFWDGGGGGKLCWDSFRWICWKSIGFDGNWLGIPLPLTIGRPAQGKIVNKNVVSGLTFTW